MLFLCAFSVQAQVFYSVNPHYLKSKTEQNNLVSDYKDSYPDTSITEQINYFPRNFMGHLGLPSPDYLWRYGTEDIGFRLLPSAFTQDKFLDKQVAYYRSKGPYASLNGIAGSKEFQILKMLFTHTYKEKVNITVGFNRYTSKGFYQRQRSYTNNFYLSSNYTTRKQRAGYYLYLLNNSNAGDENGGIRDRVITDSTLPLDKELLKVNINNANRNNRELKFMLNPWLRLNSRDSSTKINHYLQLKSNYSVNSYRYRDLSMVRDRFYNAVYLDTLRTTDSAHVKQFSNELAYSMLSSSGKLAFSAGYKNEINQVWQQMDTIFMSHILQSDLVYRTPLHQKDSLTGKQQFFETHLNAQYILAGANRDNFKVENKLIFTFNNIKNRNLFLNILYENRSADYIYNNWVSNHFLWFNNGYTTQQQMQASGGIQLNRFFTASVFYQTITNYLYFNRNALPEQLPGTITNLGVNLNVTRIFFKHLGVGLNYLFQNTSAPAYVRVPRNSGTAKLFYTGNFSNNNLQLQLGTQLQVYESFTSYAYMPSTQMFYLQDNFKTASYPFVDVYLSARIRPVSFFVKVENALQGLVGPNYAFLPGYYQPDRAFRLGLTWMFFD